MCELFYIRNKADKPIPEHALHDFVETAILGSYSNSHGTGAFNRNGVIFKTRTPLHEMSKDAIVDLLEGSREIVFHVRKSTVGTVNNRNSHPFNYSNHVLAHNGSMRNLESELNDITDSEKFLRQTVDMDDANGTIEKIKDSLAETKGWLSIFHLDKESNSLYYYRNRASFTFGESDSFLVGATVKDRLNSFSTMRTDSETVYNRFEPDEGVIYEINHNMVLETEEFDLGKDVETYSKSGYTGSTRWRSYGRYHNQLKHDSNYKERKESESGYTDKADGLSRENPDYEENALGRFFE